jgi:hypothetical protein
MVDDLKRRQETAERQAIRQRNYRRIRDRALARLRQLYPEDYEELFQEERKRDEAEGKAWLDLSGRTKRSLGSSSSPNGRSKVPVRKARRNRFKKSKRRRKA